MLSSHKLADAYLSSDIDKSWVKPFLMTLIADIKHLIKTISASRSAVRS